MKKLTALLVVLGMIFGLCSCAKNSPSNADSPSDSTQTTPGANVDKENETLEEVNIVLETCLSGGPAWCGPMMVAGAQIALSDFEQDFADMGLKIK